MNVIVVPPAKQGISCTKQQIYHNSGLCFIWGVECLEACLVVWFGEVGCVCVRAWGHACTYVFVCFWFDGCVVVFEFLVLLKMC